MTALSERKIIKALSRLEEQGAVKMLPNGAFQQSGDSSELSQAVSEGAREQNRRTEHEALRLEKMRAYAELGSCRREYLLQYFGDDGPAQCGNWDVCEFGRKRSLGR